MGAMLNIDRHIAIWAGSIAGPAFGVAMMAAPEYLHLGPLWSGLLFWGGIGVFLLTIVVVVAISLYEEKKRKNVLSLVLMTIGALIFCGGAALYFWPTSRPSKEEANTEVASPSLDRTISINCYRSVRPTHMRSDRSLYMTQIIGPPEGDIPLDRYVGNTWFIQGDDQINGQMIIQQQS
jgi:apolipoprotein N-acyltransferase